MYKANRTKITEPLRNNLCELSQETKLTYYALHGTPGQNAKVCGRIIEQQSNMIFLIKVCERRFMLCLFVHKMGNTFVFFDFFIMVLLLFIIALHSGCVNRV